MDLAKRYTDGSKSQCKLSDYVSKADIDKIFCSGEGLKTPKTPTKHVEKFLSPRANTVYCHIQHDLKSPLANMRIRALKSIHESKASSLPADEEPAEHQATFDPLPLPSIQEVMKNTVVFVEIRTGEDNRSDGVRKVIAALGARVIKKITPNTTHVVFKDGLLSTYRKAKSLNIPIVSILWIEACKTKRRICNPADFPISNLDRYENPELYEKMKRYKSMQPGSESSKKVRAKKPKESTPTTTPRMEAGKSNQASITKFFGQKNSSSDSFEYATPIRTPVSNIAVDSPATILLDRISSNTYTPIATIKRITTSAKKVKNMPQRVDTTPLMPRRSPIGNHIAETTHSIAQMTIDSSSTPTTNDSATQTLRKSIARRRRTIAPPKTSPTKSPKASQEKIHSKDQNVVTMMEEILIEGENGSKSFNVQSSIRRRTTYSCKPMEIGAAVETPPNDGQSKSMIRRRTLFTPQQMLESPKNVAREASFTKSKARETVFDIEEIIETPKHKTKVVGASSINAFTPTEILTIDMKSPYSNQSLDKAIHKSVSVNRRRTLFDVSMDIISHQVRSLNSKTRPSNVNCTPDKAENNGIGTTESKISESITPVQGNGNGSIDQVTAEKKKRKLFKPIDASPFSTPPADRNPQFNRKSMSASLATPKSVKKRRRTLVSRGFIESDSAASLTVSGVTVGVTRKNLTPLRPRRSTMDFETIRHLKSKKSSDIQSAEKENQRHASNIENVGDGRLPMIRKRLPFLAFTNMHKEQVEVIDEAVTKLGRFRMERTVSGATTHVISLEPRRTMNLLRGLVRGLWILDFKWVVDSLNSGKWLPEESYELKDFSRAVEICRAERQAFGKNYKCELFTDLGAFFISPRCDNVPVRELKELIRLCGGKVEDFRHKAKFILSNCTKAYDDKIYVTPFWILDSITQMQLMRIHKYSAVTQLPTTQSISNTRNMPTAIERKNSLSHRYGSSTSKLIADSRLSAIYSRTFTS